jgi:hypothetical protein
MESRRSAGNIGVHGDTDRDGYAGSIRVVEAETDRRLPGTRENGE